MALSLEIDHLVVAAETLEEGVAHVERTLEAGLVAGGRHPEMGTHNRLLSLGAGVYLEVIAVDPGAPPPGRVRWFGLDRFSGPPRLAAWVARVPDLDAALAAAPEGLGAPVALARGEYRWRMAVPETGTLPFDGLAPALIEWAGTAHPAAALPGSGCRLARIDLTHPRAADLAALPGLDRLAHLRLVDGPEPAIAAAIETPLGMRLLS